MTGWQLLVSGLAVALPSLIMSIVAWRKAGPEASALRIAARHQAEQARASIEQTEVSARAAMLKLATDFASEANDDVRAARADYASLRSSYLELESRMRKLIASIDKHTLWDRRAHSALVDAGVFSVGEPPTIYADEG